MAQENGSQMRITEDEIKVIKGLFKDNEPALKVMRKIFLPEIDPKAPLGGMIDLWMTVETKNLSMEEALVNLKARNMLITHTEQMLIQLSMLANQEDLTPEQVKAKAKINSSK